MDSIPLAFDMDMDYCENMTHIHIPLLNFVLEGNASSLIDFQSRQRYMHYIDTTTLAGVASLQQYPITKKVFHILKNV